MRPISPALPADWMDRRISPVSKSRAGSASVIRVFYVDPVATATRERAP